MDRWIKRIFCIFLICILTNILSAIELTFNLSPTTIFPCFSSGDAKYNLLGGGASLDTGFVISNVIDVGTELGFLIIPKMNNENIDSGKDPLLTLYPLGIHCGVFFFPFSRVECSLGIAGGACIGVTGGNTHYSPWYRAYGEVLFRLNPQWSLGLHTSWFDYQYDSYWGNPGVAGITAGIGIKFVLDTEKSSGDVIGYTSQDESVFPLFYTIYKNNPIGSIYITNHESAEITNVTVKFRAGNYTNSEYECGTINLIRKHKTSEMNLFADFSNDILQFSESGKIPGELVIDYELLGQKRQSISQVIIPVYNRNQVRWTDSSVIASYVSSSSQEVLEFSKYVVGIARNNLRSGLNRNLQFAMYLYEAIRLSGIEYSRDESTPYITSHLDSKILDYIQYPFQTLLYKTGDNDDIGILYLAILESVGISAGFIPIDDDFIVAINLGITADKAANLFDGYDRLLIINGDAWLPLSMATLREGFVNSWYKAVISMQQYANSEEEINFVNIAEAWQSYPPAGFSSGESVDAKPLESTLTSSVELDISRYITAEFGPKIAAVQARIKAEGESIELYNSLGILYVRAGMYSSAIPVYEKSAKMGSVAAMNNLGNIAILQKRFQDAKLWYEKALSIEPDNKTSKNGLNRVLSDLQK